MSYSAGAITLIMGFFFPPGNDLFLDRSGTLSVSDSLCFISLGNVSDFNKANCSSGIDSNYLKAVPGSDLI